MVHRNNIHAGACDIVRLIDYMIGRTNGQYLPGDPSFYRRRRGWETYLEIFMIATHFDLKPVPAR
jgi:hypothetical protein